MLHTRRRLGLALPLLVFALTSCGPPPAVQIDSPIHGSFLNATSVTVSGRIVRWHQFIAVFVNGVPVPLGPKFSIEVALDSAAVLNRITVLGIHTSGAKLRDTAVVVVGDGISTGFEVDGEYSPEGVALRIGDTGLGQIAPVVESLSGDSLDVSNLIAGQNPIAQGSMSGINYTANVVEVGFGGFGLDADAAPGGLDTDIQIDDFYLEVDLDLGWLGSCTLEIETATANITGSYDLSPLPADPTRVDVTLVSAVGVQLGGFTSQFVSGICDDPLLGDIINLIIGQGDIQQLMQDGFQDNLADPDGAGPQDSPLAGAIEAALAGISIAGPVGEALGGVLDAPITDIALEGDGLTITADASFTTTSPHPDAPDIPASYAITGTPPTFGPLTPDQGLPYGMAFAISTSAMNQLLKTQIENGLLRSELTEFLGAPLTAGALAFFIPAFAEYDPATPALIAIAPTMAPIMTGNPGPGGEFTELKIGGLEVDFRIAGAADPLLVVQADLDMGLDLLFTAAGIEFALASPAPGAIAITVLVNPALTPDFQLISVFQSLFPLFAPSLESAIEAFPLPSFLGLELAPVEVSSLAGGYIGLFADLSPTPTTVLANVTFTDLSSGDFRQQGGCWLREWRHRQSGAVLGNTISANLKGMLGADAGCTTNDASSSATLAHRVNFDVVSVPGEQWTLDLEHWIFGAMDRISDGYNDGIGFQDGGGTATVGSVIASWSIAGGGSGNFDFTPDNTHISDGIGGSSSNQDVQFGGTNNAAIVGTGDASVELFFSVSLDTFSNSNTAFPTANGDEMAIRLGKNDTIDNNFTAGGYPGMGSRNIAFDGHNARVELSSTPLP